MAETTAKPEPIEARQGGREALTPWLGWILGPMAWALHQGIGYAMTAWLCEIGRLWPYYALTGFAVALCAVGALAAFQALRYSRRLKSQRSRLRMRMMALVALMLCAVSLVGIAIDLTGILWLDICAGIY